MTYPLDPERREQWRLETKAELKWLIQHSQTVNARIRELKAILNTIFGEAA
jgi:hypothetical protein